MAAQADADRRYRIMLQGECRQLLAGLPGEFSIETCQGWTCVLVSVRDESELYGLLDRFQDLALHIVSLNELGAGVVRRQSAANGPPVSLRPGGVGLADWLAGAAAHDAAIPELALSPAADNINESGLDVRTHALVRLAAAVADGKPGTTYDQHIATALDHGVTLDEIVGVLVALLPLIGAAPVTVAAAAIREAIGRLTAAIPASYQAHSMGVANSRP
jgi:alkylhydroperoxidase/carboxymuconolactone decarboxylase family protein YurZ